MKLGLLLTAATLAVLAGCRAETSDTTDAAEVVDRTALRFNPVTDASGSPPCAEGQVGDENQCLEIGADDELDGSIVEHAEVTLAPDGPTWSVNLLLTDSGLVAFNQLVESCFAMSVRCPTGQVAISVDGELISAPLVQAPSFERDQLIISGDFDESEARALAASLNGR